MSYLAVDSRVSANAPDLGCLLCGAADPFGMGLCSDCLVSGSNDHRTTDERLLFLERGANRFDRKDIADRLWDLVGQDRSTSEVEAALRGSLPLARVQAGVADRAARHLRESGLPVRITHPARVGARLSSTMGAVLGTAIATGMIAGLIASPAMLLITPVFAATIVWAAVRSQEPALLSGADGPCLPVEAETLVRSVLAELPEGVARQLLGDIVRMARLVHAATPESEPGGPLTDLLLGASRLARDLAGLDESLALLERQANAESNQQDWDESFARVSRTRDRLVQKLLNALAAMARARAAGSVAIGDEERSLADLAADIEQDAVLQREARKELDRLLA